MVHSVMPNMKTILALPTPRLLTYFKKYYRNFTHNRYWVDEGEERKRYEGFKSRRAAIQTELSMREHIEDE